MVNFSTAANRPPEKDVSEQKPSRQSHQQRAPHAVIIVENMTVPPDRRVWQQANALREDGWRVSVITPKVGSYRKPFEIINGIEIHRHALPLEARRVHAYAIEYSVALALEIKSLFKIGIEDIDVVQFCNPPDFLFLPALVAKKLGHAKIVFDQHDLTPELLAEKLNSQTGPLISVANWAQQKSYEVADQVISTNSAFRELAICKGGKLEQDVTVVYSSPDIAALQDVEPNDALKKGAQHLLFWVGVMGSQDGVDLLLDAVALLKNLPGGDDFHLMIAGDGPERKHLEAYAEKIGVQQNVTFAGFLSGATLAEAFKTATIGVGSDPINPFNDRLAMNKVMEYMAYSLPMVIFDLAECRKIAGDAALYATNNDPASLAANISNLLQSPNTRRAMGDRGNLRLKNEYSWELQRELYLGVYSKLCRDNDC